jgi:hypothetical protein
MRLFLACLSVIFICACSDDTKPAAADAKAPVTEAAVVRCDGGGKCVTEAAVVKEASVVKEAAVASDAKPAVQ